ncbi:MAG: ATP-binding protein [Patescibacteria group bacterium]
MNVSILGWAVGATILSITTLESGIALQIAKITIVFVTTIALTLLHFIHILTGKPNYRSCLPFYFFGYIFIILIFIPNGVFTNFIQKYNYLLLPNRGPFYLPWFAFWLITITLAHFYLIIFYIKNINKKQKTEALLLFIALAIGCICGTINFLYFFNLGFYPLANLGISLYCMIFTYAVFKHQVMGLEIVLRKGLLYSGLITIFTCIYLIVIFISEWLFRGILGYKSIFLSLLSAVTIALLFNPLRDKIQNYIDCLFLGKTTEELARENELLKQEIERSERLKTVSSLALGVAHEIKNPLTALKTFTEFLPEKYKDENFLKKFSKIIPKEVERINNIVRQLLDFSKPSLPILKPTNICNIMDEILELMNNDFLKRRILVNEQCENHDIIANIDAAQIKQVFYNIIINAMDSMSNGGKIYIMAKSIVNEKVEIIVKDEGCGISIENLKNIFNPFFSTKDKGTGLGLSICHQIIKNHDGTIEIKSELNQGTSVIIRLPRAQA